MSQKSIMKMAPLFLVLAIDSMGLGILFPILSSMIIDPSSQFLAHNTSMFTRELVYGIVIGIYMLCWFFGAAMLGDLSDIIGRKKSLVVCLLGAAVGYAISGAAILMHSVTILIVGRIIAGFTAGSQPIAQAAIVDVSSEENKAKNIGYILLAVSLGFIIGPLCGGVFSDARFASWFNFSTPMFFAAIISIINAIMLYFFFNETHTITRKVKLRFHYAIQIFIEAFQSKKIRWLSLVLLIFISGWGEYFGFISQFLLREFNAPPLQISLFMVVLGVGFSIGFALLVDRCVKLFSLKTCVIGGVIIGAILTVLTVYIHEPYAAWIFAPFIGMGISVAYSALITMFSNQVDESEQGWVMGVTNAVMALSFGVTTFFSGFAANFGADMPLIWGFAGMFVAAFLMLFSKA